MPTRWMHVVVATTMLMMVSGCTGTPGLSLDNEISTLSALHTATNSVMSETPDLLELEAGDETILATSTNAGESIDVSPFTPTTGRIAVYSDCVGPGRITITIGSVAESSYACREGSADLAHRDDMDIDPSGTYSIAVRTDNQQLWTVTVVALPPL